LYPSNFLEFCKALQRTGRPSPQSHTALSIYFHTYCSPIVKQYCTAKSLSISPGSSETLGRVGNTRKNPFWPIPSDPTSTYLLLVECVPRQPSSSPITPTSKDLIYPLIEPIKRLSNPTRPMSSPSKSALSYRRVALAVALSLATIIFHTILCILLSYSILDLISPHSRINAGRHANSTSE
jgi:hypothetical protein